MIVTDIIFTNFPCHLQLLLLSSRDKFIYENETLFSKTCNANYSNFLKSGHTEAVIGMTCERIKCRKMNFQQILNDSSSFDERVDVKLTQKVAIPPATRVDASFSMSVNFT